MGCMEPSAGSVCVRCGWVEGTPPASPFFLPPRTVLDGRYLLGRVLGAGGFGITYLAWDLNLDLKLAVKEYFPNAFGARDRNHCTVIAANTQSKEAFDHGLAKFLQEARALARFQGHPSIASVMTFFKENGTSYLVMKYEDGVTLQDYLKEHAGRMDFETVMGIAMAVMDALRAVHQEGILHRDISPDNIIINRARQIKILDFGSAKRDMTSQDRTLQITLKRGFSPEEQYRANGRQGPWTDVYAVGATLYQCLTGNKPPDALDRLNEDKLEPPSRLGVKIPRNCEKALMKALAVRAQDRFQTMEEFQKVFVFHPQPPPHPPLLQRLRAWLAPLLAGSRTWLRGRMRLLAWAAGTAVLLLALFWVLPALFVVPQVRQFAADPATVPAGQSATLRWSVSGGKVSIAPDIGPVGQNSGARPVSPAKSTTYTLTASGPLRSVSKSVRVAVAVQSLAVAFAAEPLTIKPGESSELVWSVAGNPTSVTIDPGIGNVKSGDRLKVTPTADTTYTLKAEGPGGAVGQASVTVMIEAPVPKPAIVSFGASPATIPRGQSAQLTWKVTGDKSLAALDQNIGKVKLEDTLKVAPLETTKYKLLARNPGGAVSRQVTVEVLQPDAPKITAFTVAPESIAFGKSATLSWSVSGDVDSVTIVPGIGKVPAQGSRPVSPPATTNYLISATGPGGTSTLESTVRVGAARAPVILAFTATPLVVAPKQQVMLHWSVGGDLTGVTLDPGAIRVKAEDSRVVAPAATTRYILTASGSSGTRSSFVDVQVSAERFEIVSFEVRPAKIKRGESAALYWNVTGPVTGLSVVPAIGNLTGRNSGGARITPDKDTVYTLTAQAGTRFLTATVRISVKR